MKSLYEMIEKDRWLCVDFNSAENLYYKSLALAEQYAQDGRAEDAANELQEANDFSDECNAKQKELCKLRAEIYDLLFAAKQKKEIEY